MPANPGQQMSFQTTADLELLFNYSRRAEGWDKGIVIGQTKDDIIGMIFGNILEMVHWLYGKQWHCCKAASGQV